VNRLQTALIFPIRGLRKQKDLGNSLSVITNTQRENFRKVEIPLL